MTDADAFLPLTSTVFEVLLALADGERHGYAILLEIGERTGRQMLPGTLYRALHRLLGEQLVIERADGGTDDERRRVYRLTSLGRRVAEAESRRLAEQVDVARRRRLLRQPRG